MRTLIHAVTFAVMITATVGAQEVSPMEIAAAPRPDVTQLQEVLVTGEQPGPGLWKISKNVAGTEHVLWIVGAHVPLPKKMSWRTQEIEGILKESRRLVTWASVDLDFDAGIFSTLGALPLLFTADRNVDGAHLQDVLPPDVHSQWLVLKAKYLGKDDTAEELRPTFAWKRLRSAAFAHSGLSSEPIVEPTIERLAKKYKVKIVRPKEAVLEIKIEKPRALLKKFEATRLADVDCFGPSLANLEPGIELLKIRANAWAVGDVEKLRAVPIAPFADCEVLFNDSIFNGQLANQVGAGDAMEKAREEAKRAGTEALAAWFKTIEDTVTAHTSTVAVVPIDDLVAPGGVLESLRLRGYSVDAP